MHINRQKLTTLIATVTLISIILTAACSSSDPEALDIPITIKAGVMEPETINVKQGDMVTLKILADDGGEFHLHTYDIESEVPANQETDFYFVAEATGRFKITYHPMSDAGHRSGMHGENDSHGNGKHGDDDSHGGIFESEPIAPGESFSFQVHNHLAGKTIPFHSHLRPALNGSINVSLTSNPPETLAIEYTDEEVKPQDVKVGSGTIITWTNNSSVPQSVISGHHSDMAMGGHKAGKHGIDEHDENEEVEIGLLEVQPR